MKEKLCYQMHVTEAVSCVQRAPVCDVKTSGIKRRRHLHIYDIKNSKNTVHAVIGAELTSP